MVTHKFRFLKNISQSFTENMPWSSCFGFVFNILTISLQASKILYSVFRIKLYFIKLQIAGLEISLSSIRNITKVSKSCLVTILQRVTHTEFCDTHSEPIFVLLISLSPVALKNNNNRSSWGLILRTEVWEEKNKSILRNFSMGSSILLNSQQIKSTHKGTSQKSITKVVMQILTVMRKNIQMRNMQNFNLKFPVIIGEGNVSQPFQEKSVVFWGKALPGKTPPKYVIGDRIPAKALCCPRTAPRLISQAAVLISVV